MHLDLEKSLRELIICYFIYFNKFCLISLTFQRNKRIHCTLQTLRAPTTRKRFGVYFFYEGSLVRPYQINRSFTVHFPYQVTPTLEVLFDFVGSWDEGSITIPAFSLIGTFFDAFRAKIGSDPH